MADLLFDWFGFDRASKTVVNFAKAMQLNPEHNKHEVSRTMIPPLLTWCMIYDYSSTLFRRSITD